MYISWHGKDVTVRQNLQLPLRGSHGHRAQIVAILVMGTFLYWVSAFRPTAMPPWGPWDFSWSEYLATAMAVLWFFRGLACTPPQDRLSTGRRVAFLLGIAALYGVTQTRFDYMAQHMFFINRIQHVVMHHIGPFLVALGCAGKTIMCGMPRWLRQIVERRPVESAIRVLQRPVLAAILFVGLFYFWLIPPIHFRAMIDHRLYAVMNWSMVLDGLLFWSLVLDPRSKPPARVSFGVRMVLSIAVMFPQIILGALITFSEHDLYPYYDLCGRLFPTIGALQDQLIGGIVIWIPPAMMSVIGALLVLHALLHEPSTPEAANDVSSPKSLTVSQGKS
jgi:putative membrane protein